jgi:hypothetical protein
VLVHACASYQAATAPSLAFDDTARQNKVEVEGVLLMAKATHHESDLRQYFGDDPLQYGILPVQIRVENRSYEPFVYCNCYSINLIHPNGHRMTVLTLDQVMETLGFGVFTLLPGADNVSNFNKEMRADLESKIFRAGKIHSRSTKEGFAFFVMPKRLESLEGWKLTAVVVGVDHKLTLEVPFHGGVARRW